MSNSTMNATFDVTATLVTVMHFIGVMLPHLVLAANLIYICARTFFFLKDRWAKKPVAEEDLA